MVIQAAIAAGSAILGAIQANKAAQQEREIADRNFALQQQAYFDQNQLANKAMDAQLSGSRDARGNETRYIPGVGWVTTPSDKTKHIIDASDNEELARLTTDAASRRRGMTANEERRGKEGGVADQFLEELKRNDTPDTNTLYNAIRMRGRSGLDRGFDQESAAAMRQSARSRSSNAGNIISALAQRRAESNRDLNTNSYADAIGMHDNMRGNELSRETGAYNTMASRASNVNDTPFDPTGQPNALQAALSARQNTAPQTFGMAINAAGNNVPKYDYQPNPNYANALALGGIGRLAGAINWGGGNDANAPPTDTTSGGSPDFDRIY